MVQVEQLDMFVILQEIEDQAEAARLSEPAPGTNFPILEPIKTKTPFLKKLVAGLSWFLIVTHNLYGIACWVNVYTVTRAFGGREAGGWYYRKFTCEESRQVWIWDAEALRMMLFRRFSGLAWGVISSESVGQEVTVLVERRKAAQQSATKPLYEQERVIGKSLLTQSVDVKPQTYLRLLDPVKPQPLDQSMDQQKASISTIPKKVINKILVFAGVMKKDTCDRCHGTGDTRYKHVKNGICFKCNGSGNLERKTS